MTDCRLPRSRGCGECDHCTGARAAAFSRAAAFRPAKPRLVVRWNPHLPLGIVYRAGGIRGVFGVLGSRALGR